MRARYVLAASARVACPAARPALPRVRGVLTSRDAEFPECRACCRIRRSARAAVACTSVCPSPCRGPPPLDWLKRGLDPLRDRLSQVDALYLWRRISHVRNPERWRRQVLGARLVRKTRVRQHDERRRWLWHNDERPADHQHCALPTCMSVSTSISTCISTSISTSCFGFAQLLCFQHLLCQCHQRPGERASKCR